MVYVCECLFWRHHFHKHKKYTVMLPLIIAIIAGVIMGFSFDNVLSIIPEITPVKSSSRSNRA